MTAGEGALAPADRTSWSWVRDTPLSTFIRTETGSAMLLLAVTVLALLWAGIAPSSYESVWTTRLSVSVGHAAIAQDLRGWVNNGLMTFFFFVIGLEARRSIDIGDLRERTRVLLPLLAGIGGMVASIAIYLAFNAGGSGTHGWGMAMSTDTAFALSLLSLVKAKPLQPLRSFMLTVVVVDDVVALLVIAAVYSGHVKVHAARAGDRVVRARRRRAQAAHQAWCRVRRDRAGRVARPARVRAGSVDHRTRHGALHLRLAGATRRARDGHLPVPALPGATDVGVRPAGSAGTAVCGVAERAPPRHVPPVDQLRRSSRSSRSPTRVSR